jgi:predicted NBD/HSP70 family sugar kinase
MVNHLKNILSLNELRTFQVIYETGPISRVRVTRILHLTRAAVTGITKRLQDLGLVMEVGKEASSPRRGRKEVLLTVDPDAGLIVAVHIALHYFTVGLVNLGGSIVAKTTRSFPFPPGAQPLDVLPGLVDTIETLLRENHVEPGKAFGMGVAVPGIVNYHAGCLKENPFLEGWEGFELRRYLEEKLNIATFIENDVKTLTLGEFQFGTGYHVKDMICLWFEDGIGAGIVHNGKLIRGVNYSAGEIGYAEFCPEVPFRKTLLMDGDSGFWGKVLSFTNLERTIRRGIEQGWKTDLKMDSTVDGLIEAALARDPLALYIVRQAGQILGNIVLNLIYTFDPSVFLLSGVLFNRLPMLTDEVQQVLRKGQLKAPLETVELRTSTLGENGITVGGAALVLEHLFKTE